MTDDGREDRERTAGLAWAIADRANWGTPPARQLVEVYDGGSMPTEANKVYLCRPVVVDADESEGEIPAFATDEDVTIPVVVLGQAPSAGDRLIAHAVGGRWVAESGATEDCDPNIRITGCSGLGLSGATIKVYTDDSKTTLIGEDTSDENGDTGITIPGTGDYWVELSHPRYNTIEFLYPITCPSALTQVGFSDFDIAEGYACYGECCAWPVSKVLNFTSDRWGSVSYNWYEAEENGWHDGMDCGECEFLSSYPVLIQPILQGVEVEGVTPKCHPLITAFKVSGINDCPSDVATPFQVIIRYTEDVVLTCPPDFSVSGTITGASTSFEPLHSAMNCEDELTDTMVITEA